MDAPNATTRHLSQLSIANVFCHGNPSRENKWILHQLMRCAAHRRAATHRRAENALMHYGAKSFAHLSASIISIIWVPNFNNASAYLDMLCAMPSAHYQGSRELRDIQKISLFEKDYVVMKSKLTLWGHWRQ